MYFDPQFLQIHSIWISLVWIIFIRKFYVRYQKNTEVDKTVRTKLENPFMNLKLDNSARKCSEFKMFYFMDMIFSKVYTTAE